MPYLPQSAVILAVVFGLAVAGTAYAAAPTTRPVEIIAHRGASADAPENTLAAFRLGFEQAADAGEIDVHLSKDGKAVVIHDDSTKRTAGVDRKVVDQTLDELRKLDVGQFEKWQGKGFSEKVPTLEEVLALVPDGKQIYIEIKCGVEVMPALEKALRESKLRPEQTVFISFKFPVVEAFKRAYPDRKSFWLHSYKQDKTTGEYPKLDELIRRAKEAGLDGLNLSQDFPLDAAAVKRIHDAGLKCYVWTVDDPVKARDFAKAGVEGITTNRPAALRKEMGQKL